VPSARGFPAHRPRRCAHRGIHPSELRSTAAQRTARPGRCLRGLHPLAQTRGVAEQVNRLGPFDAVIHNAAVGYQEPRIQTEDGLPHVFAVNVRSLYVLTAVVERPKRLVHLSSGMHHRADASLDRSEGRYPAERCEESLPHPRGRPRRGGCGHRRQISRGEDQHHCDDGHRRRGRPLRDGAVGGSRRLRAGRESPGHLAALRRRCPLQ
jgi:hypothetical protein